MPFPFLIFSQLDYLIQIIDINSHTEWQTVQIQICWLLQKPTDLDLHCLQRQGISGFSRTRVNTHVPCICHHHIATVSHTKPKDLRVIRHLDYQITALFERKRYTLKLNSSKLENIYSPSFLGE